MNKMYIIKAVSSNSAVFVADEHLNEISLRRKAIAFLQEEATNYHPIEIKEVKKLDDLPKDWWEAIYYGDNPNEECPADFLQDPEYKTYLRLKKKFEE